MIGKIVIFTACALIGCNFSNAADYITEKPDYLQTCERKMPTFRECLKQAFEHILTTWKDGVPGVKNNHSVDPVFIRTLEMIENTSDAAPLDVKLINVTYTGLSKTKLKRVNVNDNDYNFKLNYLSPHSRFEGQYNTVGQIMLLKLNSSGSMFLDISNADFTISVKIVVQQRDNIKFFDLKALKFKIINIEKVRLRFENLFADKELTESTNVVFNENWRDFFTVLQPLIEKRLSEGFFKHFENIFNSVPAKFFIADVEKTE